MAALIILAVAVVLLVCVIKPKFGTCLIWLLLFTYPRGWWFFHNPLPLHIGIDDLFCIMLFLIVVVRRNIFEGLPVRFGYAFWVITSFSVITTIAVYSGSRDAMSYERIEYLKDVMKLGVYWGLFYAVLHTIDDEHDLKLQLYMFSIAALAGAIIVILQYFFPSRMVPWTSPTTIAAFGELQEEGRATGAFLNANGAACVLVCSLALITTSMRLQQRFISKLIFYGFVFVILIGVLVTKSRAGFLALGAITILMAFISRTKMIGWFIIIAAVVVSIYFAGIREAYVERIAEAYNPESGVMARNVTGRFDMWALYFKNADAKTFLYGQGARHGVVLNGMESHSAYVSLITVYGIGGTVWAIISAILYFRNGFFAKRSPNPIISTVAAGCLFMMLAWSVYGTSSDVVSSYYPRYLLFYMVTLIDRVSNFARQEQQYQMLDGQDYAPLQISEEGLTS